MWLIGSAQSQGAACSKLGFYARIYGTCSDLCVVAEAQHHLPYNLVIAVIYSEPVLIKKLIVKLCNYV